MKMGVLRNKDNRRAGRFLHGAEGHFYRIYDDARETWKLRRKSCRKRHRELSSRRPQGTVMRTNRTEAPTRPSAAKNILKKRTKKYRL